jgi:hypothetical protein
VTSFNFRSVSLAFATALTTTAAAAQPMQPPNQAATTNYTASSWDEAVRTVPCDAFTKGPDGSWKQTGTITIGDPSDFMSYNTFHNMGHAQRLHGLVGFNEFRNTPETVILDQRCGK